MEKHPRELILASASPRRSELLQRMGIRFRVHPANIEELDTADDGPERMVLYNAEKKVTELSKLFPDALVLGSDTTVALGETVLNKPLNYEEARAMLRRLSGRSHTVYTAVSLQWQAGRVKDEFVETSRVIFKHLNDTLIDTYFEHVDPLDKAGAYGIQAKSELIVQSVEGSVENVMGLPIQTLKVRFSQLGFDFRE